MGKKVGEEKQPSQNMFKNSVVKPNSLEANKKQVKDSKCSMSYTILSWKQKLKCQKMKLFV